MSLVVDLETFSLDEAAAFIEEPSAPANYRDPEKIAAYVEQKRAENLSRCALDPDLCRIVAIGIHGTPGAHIELAKDQEQERGMLDWFWREAGTYDRFVGFNILGFDLPVLIRRSQYLGVNVPSTHISLDRYRTSHIDLMERLSFNGKLKYRGLGFYCKRFGVDVPDASNGKDIDAMVKAEAWGDVEAHCRADVEKTRRLAQRLGYINTEGN